MTGTEQTTAEQKDIHILAIGSSCDETAAAVVENGKAVRSNVIYPQIATHTLYGGVMPEAVSRTHVERINQVTAQALTDAGLALAETDAIGVTYRPGFVGPLLINISAAKTMALAAGESLIGVNHVEGRVSMNFIVNPDLRPPFLCLIVSGGHTSLMVIKDYGKSRILGQTRDDAAGGAFDKMARSAGLGYPDGPRIDRKAREGDPNAISFPRTKVAGSPYDFSFSGLKGAVLNYQNHAKMTGEEIPVADLVASLQKAVVEVLVSHAMEAARGLDCRTIAMAGNVAANSALHEAMRLACEAAGYTLIYSELGLCTDNATMMDSVAYYEYCAGKRSGWNLNVAPSLKPGEY